LHEGNIIGQAANFARHLSDTPANHLTPTSLSEQAKKIADEYDLECKVFGVEKAKELGMGGFIAVDAGSDQEGKFVILEYTSPKKDSPTIALVGKGVTFDTGGISLKPSDSMTGMKFDMTGAASVIATMSVIAQLKPEVNVIGITPIVENMPSGKATRQDDIITFMNGKTAEIKSTDAEGRLILADALCYAEKFYKPDVIIDIATLTGACVYALGHFFSGLMTKDEILGTKLHAVSLITGDRVWPLPLDDDFKDAIKSDVADLSNTGATAYRAGTITAAWFLSNFVEKAKWAHLDIAGTADGVPGISYLGKGATGVGVRLLSEFVLNYKK
jgi:leucyl aminopeptidase